MEAFSIWVCYKALQATIFFLAVFRNVLLRREEEKKKMRTERETILFFGSCFLVG